MIDPLFELKGKTALLTGGTSGIGLMLARGLVARGVKTYITGRDRSRTCELAAQLSAAGGACIGLDADLADAHAPQRLAEDFRAHESRLDLLINNAGTTATGSLRDMQPHEWDLVLNVNLRAAFFLVQQLLPQLQLGASAADPARVINIGSIGGLHVPSWEAHGYGASKAALHHLTRSLAKSLGKDRVNVNAIAPGPFPSRLTDTQSDAVRKTVASSIPCGRAGEADDIVGAVVFLASRAGAYVNGATIALDGGYLAAL